MNKILSSCLIAICIGLAPLPSMAQEGGEPVVIHPIFWDDGQTVYSDQEIIFVMRWGACKKGLVQDYLTAADMIMTLDGEALFGTQAEMNRYWGPVREVPAGPGAAFCVGKTPDTIWRSEWAYSYGTLEPGDYTLHFANRVEHPVIDGGDYDGAGGPDLFRRTISERESAIHVEERP